MSGTQEIHELVDRYLAWLREKTITRDVNDWVEITTPYLDRHNDYLQIYARGEKGAYLLTDDGYVLADLEQSGCKIESARRQALLKSTLQGFGIEQIQGRLEVRASRSTFALRKHNLLQAMLAVNDLFYVARPYVASLFFEDVIAWLNLSEVRYTPKIKFTGKSGFDHLFDFVIPKSRHQPERILQALNRPSRGSAGALAFSWIDTRDVRPEDSHAYALLNDVEHTVSQEVRDALQSYEVTPVLWSEREAVREQLAA